MTTHAAHGGSIWADTLSRGDQNKENTSPTNVLQQQSRASARSSPGELQVSKVRKATPDRRHRSVQQCVLSEMPTPLPLGTARSTSRIVARRSSFGQSLSPGNAKLIVLKALGPSPSREALKCFVDGLSRDERRLFLGNSREPTPNTPPLQTTNFCSQMDADCMNSTSESSVESSICIHDSHLDSLLQPHLTEFTARGCTPSAKKYLPRSKLCFNRCLCTVLGDRSHRACSLSD